LGGGTSGYLTLKLILLHLLFISLSKRSFDPNFHNYNINVFIWQRNRLILELLQLYIFWFNFGAKASFNSKASPNITIMIYHASLNLCLLLAITLRNLSNKLACIIIFSLMDFTCFVPISFFQV